MRIFSLVLMLLVAAMPAFAQNGNYDALDAYIAKAVADHEVTGLSISIVKDDAVVFSKGYGLANADTKTAMTPTALTNIASCSKAFTAACIALLVEEGKLSWEDKIVDHIPEFQLDDPWITSQLNLRDMLSHRTSLGTFMGDLLWYETDYSNKDIISRMRHLPLSEDFRAEFGYQNNMYIIAGEIVERVTGKPWEQFVRERFLQPLDMTQTRTSGSKVDSRMELAQPHLHGVRQEIRPFKANPAASLWSSSNELANWMRMLINDGTFNGQEILSPKALNELWTMHTPMPVNQGKRDAGIHFFGYGLGWFMFDYHGKKILDHGGGMPGYISRVIICPEEKIGITILTNDMNSLPRALEYYVLDQLLAGANEEDWSATFLEYKTMGEEAEARAKADREAARKQKTKPSLDLEAYTGTYTDKMYGDAVVEMDGKSLKLTLLPAKEKFTATMEHWHFDTWKVVLKDQFLPPGYVTFEFDSNRNITGFKIDLPNPDFHFWNLDFKRNNSDMR